MSVGSSGWLLSRHMVRGKDPGGGRWELGGPLLVVGSGGVPDRGVVRRQ